MKTTIPFSVEFKPLVDLGVIKVVTKRGYPVRVISWDRKTEGSFPVVALVQTKPKEELILRYQINGKLLPKSASDLDLLIEVDNGSDLKGQD